MKLNDILLDRIGKQTIDDAKNNLLLGKGHVNKGTLLRSLNYTVHDGQLSFQIEKYGEYVDKGRKPGKWAPVDVITAWVINKKMVIRKANLKEYMNDVKGIAYLINKHIKEKGIKPTYFFTKAYDDATSDMDAKIEKIFEDYVDVVFEDM